MDPVESQGGLEVKEKQKDIWLQKRRLEWCDVRTIQPATTGFEDAGRALQSELRNGGWGLLKLKNDKKMFP